MTRIKQRGAPLVQAALMGWSDGGGGYWPAAWMIFAPLCMLIFLAVCVGVLYFATRGHRGGRPLEILKERFARGEITQAEFEEQRRILLA